MTKKRDRARNLRQTQTEAEMYVWKQLRSRRFSGFKFRRQTPIYGYIVDFYCPLYRLTVELDGESHVGKEAYDTERQRVLENAGFRVLRFWDTDVYGDLDVILEQIWRECVARGGSPSPPTPLPRGERGEPTEECQP